MGKIRIWFRGVQDTNVPCGAGIVPVSFQALPARTSTPTGGWANEHPAGHWLLIGRAVDTLAARGQAEYMATSGRPKYKDYTNESTDWAFGECGAAWDEHTGTTQAAQNRPSTRPQAASHISEETICSTLRRET